MFGATSVDPGRVAVYIRWSTEEQSSGTTLAVQRDACKYFLLSQGWQFREDLVYVDDGYSGANMERPALRELRSAVADGRVSAVVVYKLDRLSRNLLDCVSLVRQEWAKVALFSTMEHLDTQSSLGQMVFNILVSFAEFERNVIRERTMSGKRKRREQARNSGFPYPYGYRRADDGGFEIDPEQAAMVRAMFADYIAGAGLHGVAERLNAQGIPSPQGGLWRVCTVSLMLKNRFYAGHYAAGYYSYEDGKQKRGKEPTMVIENAVPAIISQEEFDRAQAVREERLRGGVLAPKDSDYLLSTILKCGKCGGPMIGHHGTARRYYRCANEKGFSNCDNAAVPAEDLEQAVLAEVKRDLSPEHLVEHVARLELKRQQEMDGRRQAVEGLEARLAELKRKRARIDDDYTSGELDVRHHARMAERLEAEEAAAAAELEAARRDLRTVEQTPLDRERILTLAEQLDGLAELSTAEIRQLLRQLLASLSVTRQKKRGRYNTTPIELTVEHNIRFLTPA